MGDRNMITAGMTTLGEIINSMSYKLRYSLSSLGVSMPGTPADSVLQNAIDHSSPNCRLNCWRSLRVLRSNNHLFVIQSDRRDYLRQRLHAEGISTGIHYPIPCHRQPALSSMKTPHLPVAERAAKRMLSLPMGPHLTQSDSIHVAEAIDGALKTGKGAPERSVEASVAP